MLISVVQNQSSGKQNKDAIKAVSYADDCTIIATRRVIPSLKSLPRKVLSYALTKEVKTAQYIHPIDSNQQVSHNPSMSSNVTIPTNFELVRKPNPPTKIPNKIVNSNWYYRILE